MLTKESANVSKDKTKKKSTKIKNQKQNSPLNDNLSMPESIDDAYCINILLTRKQLDYLLCWQESASLESMQNFMSDLKYQAIWHCVTNIIDENKE